MATPLARTAARQANNVNGAAAVAEVASADRMEGILDGPLGGFGSAPAPAAVAAEAEQVARSLRGAIVGALNRLAESVDYPAIGPGTPVAACGGGGCVTADIFTDAFHTTSGPIPACPGALDAWCQFSGAGSASLTGSSLRTVGVSRIQKPTGMILPAVNISGRFDFIEDPAETGIGSWIYQAGYVQDGFGPPSATVLYLDDSGTVLIAGPGIAGAAGIGTFTPQPGGRRIVDWAISPAGVPAISIDGVPIPLTPAAVFTFSGPPANSALVMMEPPPGQNIITLGSWLISGTPAPPPLDCGYCW